MLDPSASLGSLVIRDEIIPMLVFLSYPCTGSFLDWIGTEIFPPLSDRKDNGLLHILHD